VALVEPLGPDVRFERPQLQPAGPHHRGAPAAGSPDPGRFMFSPEASATRMDGTASFSVHRATGVYRETVGLQIT
jgi:hypothetical protein